MIVATLEHTLQNLVSQKFQKDSILLKVVDMALFTSILTPGVTNKSPNGDQALLIPGQLVFLLVRATSKAMLGLK